MFIFCLMLKGFFLSQFVLADEIAGTTQRASAILRQIDDLWRGNSSHSQFSMKIKTAHYTRTLALEGWSLGTQKTLVRILSPKKEQGVSSLKSGKHLYTYLPRTDRTIRLTSSMMMGSWMGSHFTNDDLVQESRREEDYDIDISFEGERDGQGIIEFTLMPKEDAAVVWGKVQLVVLAESLLPVKEVYYDEDLKQARTMLFSELKILGGKIRPATMRVVPSDKPEEYTEITYQLLELDIPLADSFFSINQLKHR
ncbi:MAG: outer membrane lipoprotein-sorting protein [Pseudomonadales bacterium]|nr:outer membrane lipoprotein-sorting protein [Pseudomonadales bacterium]